MPSSTLSTVLRKGKIITKKPLESDENGMIQKETLTEITSQCGVSEGMQLKIPT